VDVVVLVVVVLLLLDVTMIRVLELVDVVVDVLVDVEVLVLEVDELVEVLVLVEDEVVTGDQTKVVIADADPPGPPHVAFTVYVPATQFAEPPATVVPLYAPVAALTASSCMSTGILLGFVIVTITAVLAIPDVGATAPVTPIFAAPE
jgi:hypothetical protein